VPSTTDRQLRTKLTSINKEIRAERPPFGATENVVLRRYTTLAGRPRRVGEMYQFWFRTRGCTFDRAGQCSMCNYGVGPDIDPQYIARGLQWRMAGVPDGQFIYVSPSGSLLDPREVPRELLSSVIGEVARHKPVAFAFETRPELCLPDVFDELKAVLPNSTRVVVELGVESWNPDIRTMCQLKPTPQQSYERALALAAEYDFDVIANITLGGMGLTDAAAFADTVATVRGTRAAGFLTQIVFPLSAKAGTLLGWAHDQGLWAPPTLWMLVRVLEECLAGAPMNGPISDMDISWYNPNLEGVIQSRPDGCPRCRPMLIEVMEKFRLEPNTDTLRTALDWTGCDCLAQADRLLTPSSRDAAWRTDLVAIADRWDELHQAEERKSLPLMSIVNGQ
jgi:radical SAM enzyme (TIGR01210 family)